MKKTGKKGFTLAELCVVLAIVVIVSGMVVSFTVLFSARTRESTARLNTMNDLQLVENAIEGWMSRAGSLNVGSGSISFNQGTKTLTGTLPDGEKITVELEQVSDIDFTLLNNAGDVLCICTVTDSEGIIHTICVNPHVGDTYAAAASDDGQEGTE